MLRSSEDSYGRTPFSPMDSLGREFPSNDRGSFTADMDSLFSSFSLDSGIFSEQNSLPVSSSDNPSNSSTDSQSSHLSEKRTGNSGFHQGLLYGFNSTESFSKQNFGSERLNSITSSASDSNSGTNGYGFSFSDINFNDNSTNNNQRRTSNSNNSFRIENSNMLANDSIRSAYASPETCESQMDVRTSANETLSALGSLPPLWFDNSFPNKGQLDMAQRYSISSVSSIGQPTNISSFEGIPNSSLNPLKETDYQVQYNANGVSRFSLNTNNMDFDSNILIGEHDHFHISDDMQHFSGNRQDILASISHEQFCLYQSLALAFNTRNVKTAISALRHMYIKQSGKYRIPNILTLVMSEMPVVACNADKELQSQAASIALVSFTLRCVQWCFCGKRIDASNSFKYKMNKNISRWLMKAQERRGIPSSLPRDVITLAIEISQSLSQTKIEMDFGMEILNILRISHSMTGGNMNGLPSGPHIGNQMASLADEFKVHDRTGSGGGLNFGFGGTQMKAAMSESHAQSDSNAAMSLVEQRLIKLLEKSQKGILGAHIPAIYKEEYGEPLRLYGRKLKHVLLGTNVIEMLGGDDCSGGKRFRIINRAPELTEADPALASIPIVRGTGSSTVTIQPEKRPLSVSTTGPMNGSKNLSSVIAGFSNNSGSSNNNNKNNLFTSQSVTGLGMLAMTSSMSSAQMSALSSKSNPVLDNNNFLSYHANNSHLRTEYQQPNLMQGVQSNPQRKYSVSTMSGSSPFFSSLNDESQLGQLSGSAALWNSTSNQTTTTTANIEKRLSYSNLNMYNQMSGGMATESSFSMTATPASLDYSKDSMNDLNSMHNQINRFPEFVKPSNAFNVAKGYGINMLHGLGGPRAGSASEKDSALGYSPYEQRLTQPTQIFSEYVTEDPYLHSL